MDIVQGGKRKRKAKKTLGAVKVVKREDYEEMELDSRAALIQALIPLGLMAISETLEAEVCELAGQRYARRSAEQPYRYGSNPGTVKLAGQRLAFRVPRLRDASGEVPLESYQRFHRGGDVNDGIFRSVLRGISCRDYEGTAEIVPEAIGVSKSTVSRTFIEASARELKAFKERDLSTLDIVALFVDGKTFADDTMVIALAVTMTGQKIPVGFVQTETENSTALSEFFQSLLKRGLSIEHGLLCVVDGSKGLRKAIRQVYRKRALVQRCQWHKRENVVSYLPKSRQSYYRRRLQTAYSQPDYASAKAALENIRDDLADENQSAAASLAEGFEETLTLHRLGVFHLVGQSLKTTNCIESINAMAEQRCGKVDRWVNSSQKQRWLAAALVDIEPRLRTLMGARHLQKLRNALMHDLKINTDGRKQMKAVG